MALLLDLDNTLVDRDGAFTNRASNLLRAWGGDATDMSASRQYVIPSRSWVQIACSIASATNDVIIVLAVLQPGICRECTSITNAT